ncbi:MAG: O-antigen ligase family protein, partial [Dehalococcoidia bacterium]|nr:O-antigen ligase family protein [Dehalococcoidia bacterium]
VLWVDHVPSFLKIDDPVAASLLGAHTRGATGLYRVKATFSTALGLAEYISLLTPFAIHFAVGPYSRITKLLGVIALPVIFYIVRLTDARLGVVGFLGSFLLYSLFWGLLRFRRTRGDLVSATIVYSYPTIAAAIMILINSSHRLNSLVFGGNAQNASNNAREVQLAMGVPKILENPIGHGAANSGPSMGYAEGAFVTVDNYYLTLGLDYGVFGLTCFLALFLIAIAYAVRWGVVSVDREDPELLLLMPLAAALASFLVIKSVFSQPDNHPIIFLFLGMIVALAYRAMQGDPKRAGAVSTAG